jgi:hypothetical protein
LAARLLLTAALLPSGVGTTTSSGQAQSSPFPVAQLFFELNNTAGDLGIHAEIDGGPWTSLEVEGPRNRKLLSIVSTSRLRTHGLTQLAFESAEPPFSQLAPADFFRRFPEGEYTIEGRLQSGGTLESPVRLSHVLAAPPDNITVAGLPAAANCDVQPLPQVSGPVLIRWDPVTHSHPDIGKTGPVAISRYQLFVDLQGGKLSVDLPPTKTEYEVPFGAADRGRIFKFEIIARTSSGNNTAVESCFAVR